MNGPYRAALAASVGCALVAGLLVAAADAWMTAGAAPGDVSFLSLLPRVLGLYALPVLAAGLVVGAVAGAVSATFGPRALGTLGSELRRDRALDRNLTAGLLAGGVVLLLLAALVAAASLALVAGVERKGVGALIAGVVVAGAVPLLAAVGLPLFRLARFPARLVPRVGPLPASAVLVLAAGLFTALALSWFVTQRLDWRALNLGGYVLAASFVLLAVVIAAVAYGPATRVRQRLPRRGLLVATGAAVALVLPLALRAGASPEVAVALAEHSKGARVMVASGRALIDRDGDGFSPFLGGPDCDDSRESVHPDAPEVPGNGIDDNCLGGDRAATAAAAGTPAGAGSTSTAASGTAAPAAPSAKRADNVVIIAIDTLRADRLGAAGYRRDGKSLTPRMDQLASSASYFTRAYAQAPNTPRSFPSMNTSRYPSQVRFNKEFANYPDPLEDNLFLFEVLQSAGLHTEGIASHFYFDRAPGFLQGFDRFDNEGAKDIAGSNKDIAAPRIVPKVEARLAELAAGKERFALFVHLFEPHSTYVAHEGFPITEKGVAGLVQKYDYEIAYVDIWLGRILDAIDKNGLGSNTMVVVVSDHGEAFGVHRVAGQKMFFHGQTLYDELLRVPLLIQLPGATQSGPITDPVSLLDLAPTVIDGLGIALPSTMVGRSLIGRLVGEPLEPRPIYGQLIPAPSWNHKWIAMISGDGRYKFIYRMSDRSFELYDLEQDPTEQVNLYHARPELGAKLQEELTRWIEIDLPL